ncbi:MAG: sodium-dependent transporter [Synergistes sp.]|nr:sodium-dependent transporter [Synergistes sp.]
MAGNNGEREEWGSRFGFIMAAAGSAVGLGNIWRFPYITGKYGGAAFVLVYLAIVFIIGISVMIAEFAMGRNAKLDPVGTMTKLGNTKPGGKAWGVVGWMGFLCAFVILSYYSVIAGWTLSYMFKSLGSLMTEINANSDAAGAIFGAFIGNPVQPIIFHAIVMAIVTYVIYRGIGSGIEKSCKILMPLLFVILLLLIARSVTLDGASKGLEFYLKPDFSKLTGEGVLAAVGQGFYSLSLAMGIMITYGSYIKKDEYIPGTARTIVFLDTLVAIMAGLVIFPAAFAYNVDAGAGAGLTFITLPIVFAKMPMGAVFSFAFFALLFIAAITSSFSLFEVSVAFAKDEFGWDRKKSAIVMGIAITLFGFLSSLSQGELGAKGALLNIHGKDFLTVVDFLTNNVIMPIGGILIAVFVGWFWHKEAHKELTNDGKFTFSLYTAWLWICRILAPVTIAIIFWNGLTW